MFKIQHLLIVALGFLLASCGASGDNQGIEYAPQMYHSVPYEPLTQILPEDKPGMLPWEYVHNTSPVNDYAAGSESRKAQNVLTPPEGTVKRQYYMHDSLKDSVLFFDVSADSLDWAAANLKNPFPKDDKQVLKSGKELYTSYCQPCHGEKGDGKGKVGEKYKGVPSYAAGRVKTVSEGHIYHVITHGKGRMWPHRALLSPAERWKVVRYVQQLQQGK